MRHAIQVEELRKEEKTDVKIGSCQFAREGSHQEPAKEVSFSKTTGEHLVQIRGKNRSPIYSSSTALSPHHQ